MDSRKIGQLISKRRKQLGLSTTELARRVNLSQPQISRLENGQQGFRSETLTRISEALGVTPAYFFMEVEEEVKSHRSHDTEIRQKIGDKLLDDIQRQCGELAVTPGFQHIVKRLARILAREQTDTRVLRRLLDRIMSMTDEDRAELLETLAPTRKRDSIRNK